MILLGGGGPCALSWYAKGDAKASASFRRYGYSLLFTKEEIAKRDRGKDIPHRETMLQEDQVQELFLQGILYRDSKNWVVWVNNQKLYPGDVLEKPYFIEIINVSPGAVTFCCDVQGTKRRYTLTPNDHLALEVQDSQDTLEYERPLESPSGSHEPIYKISSTKS